LSGRLASSSATAPPGRTTRASSPNSSGSETTFRREYCCSFDAPEGLVLPDFARCLVDGPAPTEGKRVGGIDFGFRNPFAAVWGILDPDGIYHVTSRGNNRGLITFDRTDCAGLREELGAAATKYRWEVFAWCLMPNHHHVVLRAPEGAISSGYQEINGIHARRTNRRHGRVGHLFQNRFYCGEIASDAHLISAILYVVRNPVTSRWS